MHEFKRQFPAPPPDWTRPKLGEIAERVTSRNAERIGNVLTISAEFGLISQSEYFSRRVASESVTGYFLLERGDFAYNKSYSRGYPLGAIRRLDRYPKGCVSPLYICFRPRVDSVDSDFLLHYLDGGAIDAGLANVAKEGVRNHGLLNVGVADFFSLEVPLPPIAEQRMAAKVLDTLDATIRQTEAVIEKLQQIKQGLLNDLLTRGIDANGELRPPHSEAPHLYKESPLGWMPKAWHVQRLANYMKAEITYGIVQAGPHIEGGVPYIRTGDMSGNRLIKGSLLCTSRRIANSYRRSEVRAGDLVIAIRATVGKVLPVPLELDGANLTQGTARLAPNDRTDAEFLLWAIRHQRAQDSILAEIKGTTFAEITLAALREVQVASPIAIDEQRLIGERLNACEDRIRQEGLLRKKLKAQKSGLMDDLLTGRMRVTPLLA